MIEIERLQQIGLNKYEAEAYYTLLSQGPLTGYELGKHSPVPLSRSYEILERLAQKGLVLIQPGDPPRYAAIEPGLFLGRVRTTITETLDALMTTLSALPQTQTSDDFWVVRGRQHILERAQMMIAKAQTSCDLHLPSPVEVEITHLQQCAQAQGQRLFRSQTLYEPSGPSSASSIILLLIDDREALIGTLSPAERCQAVVSTNPALIALLHRSFSQSALNKRRAADTPTPTPQPAERNDWLAWEERKQRRLWEVPAGNYVA